MDEKRKSKRASGKGCLSNEFIISAVEKMLNRLITEVKNENL